MSKINKAAKSPAKASYIFTIAIAEVEPKGVRNCIQGIFIMGVWLHKGRKLLLYMRNKYMYTHRDYSKDWRRGEGGGIFSPAIKFACGYNCENF